MSKEEGLAAIEWCIDHLESRVVNNHTVAARRFLAVIDKILLASLKAERAEPVAWQVTDKQTGAITHWPHKFGGELFNNEPLFLHPPAAEWQPIDHKATWCAGYKQGHSDGVICSHSLSPRCTHKAENEYEPLPPSPAKGGNDE